MNNPGADKSSSYEQNYMAAPAATEFEPWEEESSEEGTKVIKKWKKKSKVAETWRRMKNNRTAMAGLVVISIFILFAVFADQISPFENGIRQNARNRFQPPSADNIFGTDSFGRDVFTRIIHGSRVSLTIGLFTTSIAMLVGGVLGASAGYYGGHIDDIIMRIMDYAKVRKHILYFGALIKPGAAYDAVWHARALKRGLKLV